MPIRMSPLIDYPHVNLPPGRTRKSGTGCQAEAGLGTYFGRPGRIQITSAANGGSSSSAEVGAGAA